MNRGSARRRVWERNTVAGSTNGWPCMWPCRCATFCLANEWEVREVKGIVHRAYYNCYRTRSDGTRDPVTP
jgi:hypothetical protein